MSDNKEVIQKYDTLYNNAYYVLNPFYERADRSLRFFLGDQWDENEKKKLFDDGRSTFVFNRIKPVINFLTGYQRQHRNASVVVPVNAEDQLVADQLTKVVFHIMKFSDGYRYISDAFSGAIKTGWNLLSIWMDYRNDPVNGDIRISREPYNGWICDPYFTQLDFSDCQYILRRKYLSHQQVSSLLPGHEKEIEQIYRIGWERDNKFTWLPYQRQPNGENLMAYNEMYEVNWENVEVVLDQETGDYKKWPGNKETLRIFMKQFPQMEIVKKPQQYIQKSIIVNDQFILSEKNPYGLAEYPFVPFLAIFEPESDQWELKIQSVIECMIDPQREANRRRSQMIDILDSQINSGWIADENSVVNPKSLFQTSQGKVIWRREDAKPGAIEKIPPGQIPPSAFQLQELFDKDIKDIAGVNDAAFGQMESANESGVMQLIRQGASIVNIQELMDNLRYAQYYLTKKIIKLAQTWTPEKISKIIGEQVDERFFDKDLVKYDIEVTEGVLTNTQQQMHFRQLVELRNMGVPISGESLIKSAPIQGKTEYIKEIQQQEQQQQQAAKAQQETQERIMRSKENLNQAKAISDIALSKERFTRSVANMGLEDERASQSVENRSEANLNRMKAAKELDQMDDNRLMRLIEFFMKLEEVNKQKETEVKKDDVMISSTALQNTQQQSNNIPQQPNNQQILNERIQNEGLQEQ